MRLDGSQDLLSITSAHSAGLSHATGSTPLKLPQTADSTPVRPGNNNNNQGNTNHSSGPGGNTTRTEVRDDLMRTGTVGIGLGIATTGGAAAGRAGATEALSTPPSATTGPGGISSTALANQITPERGNSGAQVHYLRNYFVFMVMYNIVWYSIREQL